MSWPWNLDLSEGLVVALRVPPLFVVDLVLKGTLSMAMQTDAQVLSSRTSMVALARFFLQMACAIGGLMVFALGQQQLLQTSYFVLEAIILMSSYWCNTALISQLQALQSTAGTSSLIWVALTSHLQRLLGHICVQLCLAFFYNTIRLDIPGRHGRPYRTFSSQHFRAITYLCFLQPLLLQAVGIPLAYLGHFQIAIMIFVGLDFQISLFAQVDPVLSFFRRAYLNAKYVLATHGIHAFIEHQWVRLKIPVVLRLFFLARLTWDVVCLSYQEMPSVDSRNIGDSIQENKSTNLADWYYHYNSDFQGPGNVLSAGETVQDGAVDTMMREVGVSEPELVVRQLLVGSCDTLLGVLGITSILSYLAHYLGVLFTMYLGTHAEDDQSMGTVTAILFFILALQTGLTGMATPQRMLRLYKNFCLLFTAILHFLHSMVHPLLMNMNTSRTPTVWQHARPLLLCIFLVIYPAWFVHYLWGMHELSTWLLAVTAFSIEVTLKVVITLMVYTLFIIDAYRETFWEGLDDCVYYIKAVGSSIEFLFGLFLFCNGGWIFLFESRGAIRAFMMCIHAYFNIWVQAKEGWKVFIKRRTAVQKINSLPEATADQLADLNDVCAICYQELRQARVTNCNHYFHGVCLRKWLYIQDKCPLCHQLIYKPDEEPSAEQPQNNGLQNQRAPVQ